jgi:hypothetical protein
MGRGADAGIMWGGGDGGGGSSVGGIGGGGRKVMVEVGALLMGR